MDPLHGAIVVVAASLVLGLTCALPGPSWFGSGWRQALLDEGHEPALADRAARYMRSPLAAGRRRG